MRAFTIAGTPPSWEQQLAAGLLDLGHEAVVSHRAAAALHGFDGFSPKPIEFTVPRVTGGAESRWRVHTSGTLDGIDRCSIGMFRCTTASRTIIDLARTASPAELERAIDSAIRDGLSSPRLPPPSPVGPPWLGTGRRSAARRAPGRRRRPQRPRADVPPAGARGRAPTTDLPADLPSRRPNVGSRGLQLRAEPGDRRGVGTPRPQLGCRTGEGRSTPQRAAAPRAHRARLHRWSGAPRPGLRRAHPAPPPRLTIARGRRRRTRCGQIGHERWRGGGRGHRGARASGRGGGQRLSAPRRPSPPPLPLGGRRGRSWGRRCGP